MAAEVPVLESAGEWIGPPDHQTGAQLSILVPVFPSDGAVGTRPVSVDGKNLGRERNQKKRRSQIKGQKHRSTKDQPPVNKRGQGFPWYSLRTQPKPAAFK